MCYFYIMCYFYFNIGLPVCEVFILCFQLHPRMSYVFSVCLYIMHAQRSVLLSSSRPRTCTSSLFSIANVLFLQS